MIPETPVRVEYSLPKKGRALAKAIEAITHWAEEWIEAAPQEAASRPGRRRSRG